MDINWGDSLSPNNVEQYTFGASATQSQTFTLTHKYLDDNPTGTPSDNYIISLTLQDDDTGTDTDSATVTVNNVDPTVEAGEDVTFECCVDEIPVNANFSDPGWLDTHTAQIKWGDGTIEPGIVTEDNMPPDATGNVTGSHLYCFSDRSATGVYVVTVTVFDDDKGQHSDSFIVTIVDTTLPDIAITDVSGRQDGLLEDNEYWNDTPVVISFSASDLCDPYLDIMSNYGTVDYGTADRISAGTVTIDPYTLVGEVTVDVTATDDAGNDTTASVTVKFVTPMSSKQEVLAELNTLPSTGDKKTDDRIEKGIEHLEKSLEPEYWETDWTLTPKAKKVFDEEKKAAHELMKLKDAPPATVTDAIHSLVVADELSFSSFVL